MLLAAISAVCLALALLAWNEHTVVMGSIEQPMFVSSRHMTWNIPATGITIGAPVYISGDLKIQGGCLITIKSTGRLVVEKNARLNLQKVSLLVNSLTDANDKYERKVILLRGGQLAIDTSNVVVDVPFNSEKILSATPCDEAPRYWLVGVSGMTRTLHWPVAVRIENTKFLSRQSYAAGAIYLSDRPKEKLLSAGNTDFSNLTGVIRESEFRGSHGALL